MGGLGVCFVCFVWSLDLFSGLPRRPFNTWDRQPYLFTVGDDKTPTTTPATSHVSGNFLFCSYGGIKGIDHDDGSGFYDDRNNFMPYCSGKMKGQKQRLEGNVYLYPEWGTQCVHVMGGMAGSYDPMVYVNNTCVARSAGIYSSCGDSSSQ